MRKAIAGGFISVAVHLANDDVTTT